ncbi:acyltransferase family protein [Ochrobactrum sp. MYb379]|uniref:acyltransferase family protein n=1 Tax=Ochrobactrum sp. MYb379 TaxID=2745275 RepID=UPI0030A13A7A
MTYRLDIEGLRAVAVLLVVIFHINESLIPGGFIGVDLFFVISGYVITQRIYKDGLNSLADFGEFYRRRIRRITPIMLFVTAITLIVGIFVLLPEDLMDLSWSAIFASFSAANVYFTYFLDTSYFAKDSNYVPLLHLWSLGVEEQFYLIWPLLLFVLLKFPRAIFPVLIALMVASVAWGEYWIRTGNYSAAYYMLPSRAFQLCAGGFCLFLAQAPFWKNISTRILLPIGIAGGALVAGSAYILSGQDPFPGLNAIPVTLGASLLLLAGTKPNILSRALSLKPLIFIGGISYSMYLWHWPILAYLRYAYVNIDFTIGTAVFIAIIFLSYLSTRYIEGPFRHSRQSLRAVTVKMFALPTLALSALCIIIINDGAQLGFIFGDNYQTRVANISESTKPAGWYKRICQKELVAADDLNDPQCIIGGNSHPRTLFWGDSNAAQYVETLAPIAAKFDISFRNISHSGCPPLFDNAQEYSAAWRRGNCEASTKLIRSVVADYDHIIIGGAFASYLSSRKPFIDDFEKTLQTLTNMGKKVTIIGQIARFKNYDRMCSAKAIKLGIDCEKSFVSVPNLATNANRKISHLLENFPDINFFDFNRYICSGGTCSPYINFHPIYFNDDHLSIDGSIRIGTMASKTSEYDTIFSPTHANVYQD